MGGGDVKLMAGFGALLGAGGCSKRLCGPLELAESWRWRFWDGGRCGSSSAGSPELSSAEEREREASIPYAPAIALGVWLSLVPKG